MTVTAIEPTTPTPFEKNRNIRHLRVSLTGRKLALFLIPDGGLQSSRCAKGGTSTSDPISRRSACCSGPSPLRKNSPSSMWDSRPPEGALG